MSCERDSVNVSFTHALFGLFTGKLCLVVVVGLPVTGARTWIEFSLTIEKGFTQLGKLYGFFPFRPRV